MTITKEMIDAAESVLGDTTATREQIAAAIGAALKETSNEDN